MQQFSMKPMGVGGIIDRAFRLYRGNFAAMILISLLLGGTADLIVALLQLGSSALSLDSPLTAFIGGASWEVLFDSATGNDNSSWLTILLNLAIMVFITPLITGGITYIALAVSHGDQDSGGGYLARTAKLYGKLVGTAIALVIINGLAILAYATAAGIFAVVLESVVLIIILIVIGILLIMTLTALAYPVAIHESLYGFKWWNRAWTLVFRKFWKCSAVVWLTSLIVFLLSFVVGMVASLLPPLLRVILETGVDAVLRPIPHIAAALMYLDIRMTTEGYDLELRANAVMNQGQGDYHG